MREDSRELSLKLGALRQLADAKPEVSRELFYWALAMVTVERGKGRIVEQRTSDGREHYTFESPEGDVVSLVKPDIGDAALDEMMAAVRAIVEEESRHSPPPDQT